MEGPLDSGKSARARSSSICALSFHWKFSSCALFREGPDQKNGKSRLLYKNRLIQVFRADHGCGLFEPSRHENRRLDSSSTCLSQGSHETVGWRTLLLQPNLSNSLSLHSPSQLIPLNPSGPVLLQSCPPPPPTATAWCNQARPCKNFPETEPQPRNSSLTRLLWLPLLCEGLRRKV